MGIFRRVNDILAANLNELVGQFEKPETMLKQAVREMEQAVHRTMHRGAQVIAQEKLLTRQQAVQQEQIGYWQTQAEQAVRNSDDNAARRALLRKSEHEQLLAPLGQQLASVEQASQRLRHQVQALRTQLAQARGMLAALLARKAAAEIRKHSVTHFDVACSEEQAFTRFQQLSQQVEQSEAEAEALLELAGGDLFESALTETELQVEAALKVLKEQQAAGM